MVPLAQRLNHTRTTENWKIPTQLNPRVNPTHGQLWCTLQKRSILCVKVPYGHRNNSLTFASGYVAVFPSNVFICSVAPRSGTEGQCYSRVATVIGDVVDSFKRIRKELDVVKMMVDWLFIDPSLTRYSRYSMIYIACVGFTWRCSGTFFVGYPMKTFCKIAIKQFHHQTLYNYTMSHKNVHNFLLLNILVKNRPILIISNTQSPRIYGLKIFHLTWKVSLHCKT